MQIANWSNNCWELAWTKWWPEYDYPLGESTSPGGDGARVKRKRWKYARSLKEKFQISR